MHAVMHDGCIGRRMLERELVKKTARKEKRGRHKRRCMDAMREDMEVVEVTEEDAEDMTELRWKIRCGDGINLKKKKRRNANLWVELERLSCIVVPLCLPDPSPTS